MEEKNLEYKLNSALKLFDNIINVFHKKGNRISFLMLKQFLKTSCHIWGLKRRPNSCILNKVKEKLTKEIKEVYLWSIKLSYQY